MYIPKPPLRQETSERFSSFLNLERLQPGIGERGDWWLKDARLIRSMREQMRRSESLEAAAWVHYWLDIWQQKQLSLARAHLAAYLQESCFRAAEAMAKKLALVHGSLQFSVEDCFQIAIANLDKVLVRFNPEVSANLEAYAHQIFRSKIRDEVHKSREVRLISEWLLLRTIGKGTLIEALQAAGLSREAIESHLLAWRCYVALYVPENAPENRQFNRPPDPTWQAIARLYSQESGDALSAAAAEQWLLTCARSARQHLNPRIESLNAPQPETQSEPITFIRGAADESPLDRAIAEEAQAERATQLLAIRKVLSTAVIVLESESQKLLELYYGEQLTQAQIAARLAIRQSTVSRRLAQLRAGLLGELAGLLAKAEHIVPSRSLLMAAGAQLDEWLTERFASTDSPIGESVL